MDTCFICDCEKTAENCCDVLPREHKFKVILAKLKTFLFTESNYKIDIKVSLYIECLKIEKILRLYNINTYFSINFDEARHSVDTISVNYLKLFCDNINNTDFIPVFTIGDGNCLYNSISRYITDSDVTVEELRVRVIVSMVKNWDYFENLFLNVVGPLIEHIKNAVTMGNYSELYELVALSNVLDVNIQSVYPKIKKHENYNEIQWTTHNQLFIDINKLLDTQETIL